MGRDAEIPYFGAELVDHDEVACFICKMVYVNINLQCDLPLQNLFRATVCCSFDHNLQLFFGKSAKILLFI